MNKIIYIGMDVHSSNYTLCSFEPGYGIKEDRIFGQVQFKEDFINNTEKYIKNLRKQRKDVDVVCGYEAGCLGYAPQRELALKVLNASFLHQALWLYRKAARRSRMITETLLI